MINLLVLIDTRIGGGGGAERHLEQFITLVDYDKFNVDVIQFGMGVKKARIPPYRSEQATLYLLPGAVHPLSPRGIRRALKVFGIMRSKRYDCVLSFFETSDLVAALLGPLAGIKKRISNRRDTGFRLSPLMQRVYRFINPRFTHFVAVSDAVKSSLIAANVPSSKILTIYNAVQLPAYSADARQRVRGELDLPADALVISIVASLFPVKDHATLLNAAAPLIKNDPSVYLLLIGSGPEQARLADIADKFRITDHVVFTGHRDDIPEMLAATDIFALSSLTEGLSNALLEAMAAAKPVVVTAVGGNPEVVRDEVDGFLVPAGDAEAFTRAFERLLSSSILRNELGRNARDRVQATFSIDTMLKHYTSILH